MNGSEQMNNTSNNSTQSIADYLAQLLKDRKQLAAFPNVFIHVERLLDEEIAKVRASLFQINGVKKEPLILPEPDGPVTTLTEKVYVPVKEHPDFNFVGRILGPRGMTAKQLEQETGCKIMVRGKGSMRDKKKEDQNRGKPNWEHLADELHVLLTVEDTENRAQLKLARAVDEVKKLLVPQADGEDELKKRQLMELAIINGTYRDSSTKAAAAAVDFWSFSNDGPTELSKHATIPSSLEPFFHNGYILVESPYTTTPRFVGEKSKWQSKKSCDEEWRRVAAAAAAETQRLLSPAAAAAGLPGLRAAATPLGAPLILSPRGVPAATAASLLPGPPTHPDHLIYTPYADYANYAAALSAASPLLTATAEYAADAAGAVAKQRRHLGTMREHPYQRAGALS